MRCCVFNDSGYTLDAHRFALVRKRTVRLKQYVLLQIDAHRKSGEVYLPSCAYTAPFDDLWSVIFMRVIYSDFVEQTCALLKLYDGVVQSFQ